MLFKLFVFLVTLAAGVLSMPHKRAPAQVVTSCTVPNTAALTFDDGPYWYLYDISKTLLAHNAKGTFFFNGNNYECIYSEANAKRVKYAYDKGHQVASHTWGHKNLSTLTWDQIHDEMWRVEEALMKITGTKPAFMRPPYGAYNGMVRDASGIRGQTLALWDFDTRDSLGATVQQQKASIDALVTRHPNTVLSLAHEVYVSSAHEVLPYAIQKLQAAGYRLVTLAECLGKPAYQSVGAPQPRDSTWHC